MAGAGANWRPGVGSASVIAWHAHDLTNGGTKTSALYLFGARPAARQLATTHKQHTEQRLGGA